MSALELGATARRLVTSPAIRMLRNQLLRPTARTIWSGVMMGVPDAGGSPPSAVEGKPMPDSKKELLARDGRTRRKTRRTFAAGRPSRIRHA